MRDADWDQLFLQFVRKRGLRDVETAFARYVRTQPQEPEDGMSVSQHAEVPQNLIEELATFAAENDAAVYTDTYERLATWVDNSLDMYRPELRKLLHPVFVRCYMQLIEQDAAATAAALLARYRARVLSSQGGLRRSIAADLQQLTAITSRHTLRSSPFAASIAAAKATVSLSPFAHELLLRFLHHGGSRMLPLLSIANSHIDLQVLEVPQRGGVAALETVEEEEMEGGDGGWEGEGLGDGGPTPPADMGTAVLVNRSEVKLGLLQGNIEDLYREQLEKQRAEAAAAAAAAAAAGDGAAGGAGQSAGAGQADGLEPPSKKAKKAAEKAAAAAAAAAAASRPEIVLRARIEHPPFLPRLPDEVVATGLRDIAARAPVSAATPPSCAFFTFVNAKQTLTCCTLNRDGSKIVAGFTDSSVRMYDMPTISAHHAQLRRYRPRPGCAAAVATANGGGAASDGAATCADKDDEAEPPGTSHMHGHTAAVHAVDMTVDQRLILSGSSDGTVRLWGTEFGSCLAVYPGHMYPVWDLACSPVGHWFASGGADRVARLWVTERTAPLRLLVGHGADVDVVRWHPNSTLLATASADRTLRLWDVREGKCVRYLSGGLYGSPTAMALSPDGLHLAAGTDEGQVGVWDLASARRLAASPPAASHSGAVWALCYSQGDGTLLASGGADETVRLWRNDLAEVAAGLLTSGIANQATAGSTSPAAAATKRGATAARSAAGGTPGMASPGEGGAAGGKREEGQSAEEGGGGGAPTGRPGGGGSGGGPYGQVGRYRTKSSPVVALQFSSRNLLLAAGPFHRRGPFTR